MTIRNGINVDQLVQTVEAVTGNPDLARFRFKATSTWQGGQRSRAEVGAYWHAGAWVESRKPALTLAGDEPPVLLGTDTAPNAVEQVLAALAGCFTVGYATNAAALGIELDELRFELEGDLDLHAFLGLSDTVRPGFSNIRCRVCVQSAAPREQLEALRAHVERTSPVLDILRNPVPVQTDLEITRRAVAAA